MTPMEHQLAVLGCDALAAAQCDEGPPHMTHGAVQVFCDYVQETGWEGGGAVVSVVQSPAAVQSRPSNWWAKNTVRPTMQWLRWCVCVLLFGGWSAERWPIRARRRSQLYTVATVTMNGQVLAEGATVSAELRAEAQGVYTMARGYVGTSEGRVTMEVAVTDAIPRASGLRAFVDRLRDAGVMDLGVHAPQGSFVTRGFVTRQSLHHTREDGDTLDFSFTGDATPFE